MTVTIPEDAHSEQLEENRQNCEKSLSTCSTCTRFGPALARVLVWFESLRVVMEFKIVVVLAWFVSDFGVQDSCGFFVICEWFWRSRLV